MTAVLRKPGFFGHINAGDVYQWDDFTPEEKQFLDTQWNIRTGVIQDDGPNKGKIYARFESRKQVAAS